MHNCVRYRVEDTEMPYIVLFEDDATRADMRMEHMSDHLSFLERNARFIHGAGPLIEADDGSAAGGLWLVEADNLGQVRTLYQSDPFWPTGLRKAVRVLEWKQVFAAGKRII
jgi:uncharacterized protein YciI